MKHPQKAHPPSPSPKEALPEDHIQKMHAFGEFAGGIAHDFNNILTIFQGYTELLQAAMAPGDALQEYLREMEHAVERARGLTTQLLNFSRRKPSAPEPVSLGWHLMEFRKMLRRIIPQNIELTVDAEQASWILADLGQLDTLLINLVANACAAMPEGGRLSVTLTETATQVRIVVSDTGLGMETLLLERIFEPGFTTQPGEHRGMGLPICAAIAKTSGGKITVRSVPGKGSAFHVVFPRIPDPATPKHSNPKPPKALKGKGEMILVVEDDFPTQKAVMTTVRRLGYRVLSAANGDEALRILQREREIRLVITDLVMPLMGGIELAELVRCQYPGTKVVLTSGYVFNPPDSETNLTQSFFLPKPVSGTVLAKTLRELLND